MKVIMIFILCFFIVACTSYGDNKIANSIIQTIQYGNKWSDLVKNLVLGKEVKVDLIETNNHWKSLKLNLG